MTVPFITLIIFFSFSVTKESAFTFRPDAVKIILDVLVNLKRKRCKDEHIISLGKVFYKLFRHPSLNITVKTLSNYKLYRVTDSHNVCYWGTCI